MYKTKLWDIRSSGPVMSVKIIAAAFAHALINDLNVACFDWMWNLIVYSCTILFTVKIKIYCHEQ